jgi:DNA polymerase-1
MAKKKLFLIDGSAIFYRSYFAFIRNPLINSKGENTSATFGFLNTLFKLIEEELPEYLAVIFDTREPTFRHKIYTEYKATREKMPEEMAESFPRLIQTLETLHMNIIEKEGYEADDIIATLSKKYASDDLTVFIVSGDKDLAQIINKNIYIYSPARMAGDNAEILDREGIKNKYGVYPEKIIDWLALMGDKSDNVPGIPSVGEKTAERLIDEFHNLENIYNHLDEIKKEILKQKIIQYREQAFLSKELVTLQDNVPLDLNLDNLRLHSWDKSEAEILLKDLEFNRLLNRTATIHDLIEGGGTVTKLKDVLTSDIHYQLIDNKDDFNKIVEQLNMLDEFAFDLETDSLDTFSAKIAGISFSYQENNACYLALNHPGTHLPEKYSLEKLKPFFENHHIRKIGQNIKFDTMILRQHGIDVKNIYFDTMIASYLINPSSSQHNLDSLAAEYLDYKTISIKELIGTGKNQKKMTDLAANDVYKYACEDADITYRLKHILEPKLKEHNLENLFFDIEMPLVSVIMEMEEHGVTLDLTLLNQLSKEFAENLKNLQQEIFNDVGEPFNLNSPQQLGVILFDKLEIHKEINMRKPSRTKTGQYSTSEAILERFSKHPLPKKILEYRKLNKLKNTYVDALPGLINKKTGRIHTSYNQTVAATGRLSSSNPNLQNIPIRTEIGRQIRNAFIPSQPDLLILSADYSQIELRIMAHLSKDEKMIECFKQDLDIHAATAAQIFNIPIKDVTEDQRRKAKEINFGIIYGMSKYGLANRLEISVEEAERFLFNYFSTYPRIQEFMRETIDRASKEGYVSTMMLRRRYLPQIHNSNRNIREFAERTSINTPIQGTAADLIKKAMIDISKAIKEKNLKSKMILQVHDELVFEILKKELDTIKTLVTNKMENAIKLDVPIKVEIGEGNNWLEAH